MSKQCSKKISSYLNQFLKVLSKPQRGHFLVYLTGLIWLVKFRSIREIAAHFGGNNTDGLHHFLKNVPRVFAELQEGLQSFSQTMIQGRQDGLLILGRYLGSKRRQTYRRLGAASFGQRASKWFV